MRIAIAVVALAMLVSCAFADNVPGPGTNYTIGQNGAEARGAVQTVAGNWFRGSGGVDGWVFSTGNPAGPAILDVQADVSVWETDVWNNSQFYFHFGNSGSLTDTDKSAIISGTVESNTPIDVQIYSPLATCDISKLTMVSTDTYEGTNFTIGLKWEYLTGTTWNLCADKAINRVQAYPLLGVGVNPVSIRVTADPAKYQADGHYHLDPIVACTPVSLN
jgi:hypothetical protein